MAANMYLRQMQRTIEILQAQMNQQQEPSMDEAQAQAKRENKEYEEDLHRKAEEAREFKQKWEESQWSKHDRQEQEVREKAREQKEGGAREHSGENAGQQGAGEGTGSKDSAGSAGDRTDGAGDAGGNEAGEGQGADGEQDKNAAGEEPGRDETVSQKIKRLYRKIVKRLHPDVHPNATEHEKDLLNQAMKAFQKGELQQLERIWDELCGMDAPEDMFDDTPEGREKLRELLEKLRMRLTLLEREIDHIKNDFPYKLKQFLEDPVAVEEVRRGIQSKIDSVREMNRQLEAFINELSEKLRKGEKL